MSPRLKLYTRKECCLCDEMKRVITEVAADAPLEVQEIDVDSSPDLREKYGDEVPVLTIDGRKAFKYRATAGELKKRLRKAIS